MTIFQIIQATTVYLTCALSLPANSFIIYLCLSKHGEPLSVYRYMIIMLTLPDMLISVTLFLTQPVQQLIGTTMIIHATGIISIFDSYELCFAAVAVSNITIPIMILCLTVMVQHRYHVLFSASKYSSVNFVIVIYFLLAVIFVIDLFLSIIMTFMPHEVIKENYSKILKNLTDFTECTLVSDATMQQETLVFFTIQSAIQIIAYIVITYYGVKIWLRLKRSITTATSGNTIAMQRRLNRAICIQVSKYFKPDVWFSRWRVNLKYFILPGLLTIKACNLARR